MRHRYAILALAMAVGLGGPAVSAEPRTVSVAAAADLQFALADAKAAFVQTHPGVQVAATFGSSGNFYAQIVNGAPFDVFLSADESYPQRLVQAGLAEAGSVFRYSRGRLVLWVPRDSPIALERLGVKALLDPAAKRIAIANPRHAPYGRAAEAALAKLGLLDAVKPRLVFGENISQTAQFVQSGAADIGILALALTKAPALAGVGRSVEVPLDAYPPLEQAAVLLARAKDNAAARAFCDFLRSPEGTAILKQYGFLVDGH
jgi:molybdate transport system substrate-binding protein